MTSTYLVILFLKQTPLREKYLRIFISYLLQDPLKEYLFLADIYKGKKNRSKNDLIDMITTEKDKTKSCKAEHDDLIQQKANLLLKNSNFVKQSTKESNNIVISPEKPKPFNKS